MGGGKDTLSLYTTYNHGNQLFGTLGSDSEHGFSFRREHCGGGAQVCDTRCLRTPTWGVGGGGISRVLFEAGRQSGGHLLAGREEMRGRHLVILCND